MNPKTPDKLTKARQELGRRSAKARKAAQSGEADRAAGIGVLRGGKADCVHHWKLPPPAGALGKGICSRCKGTILLRNSTDSMGWKELNDAEGYYAFNVR
jgi:hypothetical protein